MEDTLETRSQGRAWWISHLGSTLHHEPQLGPVYSDLHSCSRYLILSLDNDVVGDVETSNAEQSQEVARSPAMMGIHAIQLKTHSSVSNLHRTMSKKEKGASRENVQTV